MSEAGLDERVARLEGRVEGFNDRFDGLERRIDGLARRVDESTVLLSTRIDTLDAMVDRFREELRADLGGRIAGLGGRLDTLDQKVSRQFTWTTGIQVAVLLAVVAALAGR
jgi:hypothetical protein